MKTRATSRTDLLLARAKAGDAQAIDALFSLYQNYVRLLATTHFRSKLRARVSASDIVQDTFLKAHRGFGDFRGTTGGEFVVWLRSILSRQIQTLYEQHVTTQSRDVRRELSLEEVGNWIDRSTVKLEAVLVASDLSPGTDLQNHERTLRVADAIARLSVDHREVLLLRSIEELGYNEIAQQMQRSTGAVRMLWLRAIESLRDELSEEE